MNYILTFLSQDIFTVKLYQWIVAGLGATASIFTIIKFFKKTKEGKSQKIEANIKGNGNHSSHSQKM